MNKPLSKTAALKAAQSACGSIIRRSPTDFVCMVPFYDDQLSGPSTEIQSYSRQRLVCMRACVVARIALTLMGKAGEDTDVEIERASWYGCRAAHHIVDSVLRETRP